MNSRTNPPLPGEYREARARLPKSPPPRPVSVAPYLRRMEERDRLTNEAAGSTARLPLSPLALVEHVILHYTRDEVAYVVDELEARVLGVAA